MRYFTRNLAIFIQILAGLVSIGRGVIALSKRNELKNKCTVQTDGAVLDVYSGAKKAKLIKFKYSAEGVDYVQDDKVDTKLYDSKSKGGSVAVLYDPSDPNRFYVPENSFTVSNAKINLAAGVFFFVLAYFY
ncbi:MAG: hypothetical protein FWG09_08180 [Synergistaceae bacterium]|nr:hypothetical protein [Synergistaceae bacterium]